MIEVIPPVTIIVWEETLQIVRQPKHHPNCVHDLNAWLSPGCDGCQYLLLVERLLELQTIGVPGPLNGKGARRHETR